MTMPLERVLTHQLIRTLRLTLPLVIVALVAVPSWNYWIRRGYPRAQQRPQQLSKDLAVKTDGFTFSRTEGGRTVFTARARTNLGFKDNKDIFQDVDVLVYGDTESDPVRRITSKECHYDEQSGDILFLGGVQVQLDDHTYGRTDELTYHHLNRLVVSNHRAEIERPGSLNGAANNLEYNLSSGLLRLSGNVVMDTPEKTHIDSEFAEFQQKEDWATATERVVLRSKNGWISGNNARVDLTPESFQPRLVVVDGNVSGESSAANGGGTWKMRAPHLKADISATGQVERILTWGGVELQKVGAASPQFVTGGELEATLDPSGKVDVVEARQNARMILGTDGSFTLRSEKIRSDAGGAITTEAASVLEVQDSVIEGDHFNIQQGETTTFQTLKRATLRSSSRETSADHTEAQFETGTNRILAFVQTGNFVFKQGQQQGTAHRAALEENGDVLVLDGSPVVNDAQMRLSAAHIQINQASNSFVATGNVKTVMKGSEEFTVVTSNRAEGNSDAADYSQDVQLWRSTAYVRANQLHVSAADNRLHAEGNVRSNLEMIRASADKLEYDEDSKLAHYTGNVRAQKQDMIIEAADVVARTNDNVLSEMVAKGKVVLTRGGQRGFGDQAVYDATTEHVTLTGPNARVEDPERGTTTGNRVVMNVSGDKMAVEGQANEPALSKHRVKK
jgi:lipopolysaccharide transport protein LptA